jgi:hypothetical protein
MFLWLVKVGCSRLVISLYRCHILESLLKNKNIKNYLSQIVVVLLSLNDFTDDKTVEKLLKRFPDEPYDSLTDFHSFVDSSYEVVHKSFFNTDSLPQDFFTLLFFRNFFICVCYNFIKFSRDGRSRVLYQFHE